MSGTYVLYPPGAGTVIGSATGVPYIVGTFDSAAANANGATIGSFTFYQQGATATLPGLISSAAQTFAGNKTFSNNIIMSSLTASQAVVTNGSKNFISMLYTSSNNGSSLASRDTNGNTSFNNSVSTATTVPTTTQTVTMSAGSARIQKTIGSTTAIFTLPDATTLISGWTFEFNQNSLDVVTINDKGSNLVASALPGSYPYLICTDNSTTNGVWDVHWLAPTSSVFSTGGLRVTGSISATSLASAPVLSNSGGGLVNGSVSLTAQVVDTLPIANGGTNGTTATTGFNNISPITTAGDLIVGSGSANAIRLGIGLGGMTLKSVGGMPSWGFVDGGTTATQTANYTTSSTDGFIRVSSSSFTITLSTPVGVASKVYKIFKTDENIGTNGNFVTVLTPSGSILTNGSASTTLNTKGECLTVISDNTNWNVVGRKYPNGWNAYTPTGSWTNPETTYFGQWMRVNDSQMEVMVRVTAGAAPTATSLIVSLPTGVVADLTTNISVGGSPTTRFGPYSGKGILDKSGGSAYPLDTFVNGSTTFAVDCAGILPGNIGSVSGRVGVTNIVPVTIASSDMITASYRFTVLGWPNA